MKLTMDVHITANQKHLGYARKEFDTNVLPYVGLEIDDTAWKDTRKILSVALNFQKESIYVVLEGYDMNDEEKFESMKDMFKAHDWEVY